MRRAICGDKSHMALLLCQRECPVILGMDCLAMSEQNTLTLHKLNVEDILHTTKVDKNDIFVHILQKYLEL